MERRELVQGRALRAVPGLSRDHAFGGLKKKAVSVVGLTQARTSRRITYAT